MQSKYYHKIIGFIIVWSISIGTVWAYDDCALVQGKDTIPNAIKSYGWPYQQFFPKEALQQALTNLKAYCCTKDLCSQEEKQNLPNRYPKSAYLFDHLLDISMRRLDGIQSLAYGLTPDTAGKNWRTYTQTVGEDTNGVQAQQIVEKYEAYWSIHSNTTKNRDSVLQYFSWENNNILSLRDKYDSICILTQQVYMSLQGKPVFTWDNNKFIQSCHSLVNQRIQKEHTYIKLLIIKKSTQLLHETTKKYTKSYFVEEKLMALQKIILRVKDMFQTIVKQAPVSKTCSQ